METARKTPVSLDDQWVSARTAAAMLGISRHGVLVAIAKGELVQGYVADRLVVTRESVEALKAARAAAKDDITVAVS